MILKMWIDQPRGMLLVELGVPHRGGGACWTPLTTWPQAGDKMKKNWWKGHEVKSTEKRKQMMKRSRKAEAKIENGGDSGLKEPEWQLVRRRRRRTEAEGSQDTDEVSLADSVLL